MRVVFTVLAMIGFVLAGFGGAFYHSVHGGPGTKLAATMGEIASFVPGANTAMTLLIVGAILIGVSNMIASLMR